ncbi:hypothetical protein BAY61_13380 [Prauserella marina]|uniref:Uncharacterized protein n=1 Tax=Prauserella marina TaxID=530584 RepID=A0A222VPI4_9PSEU|nr:hypothetical protein [Prauserella marina]ASR35829.1 hypothetical protein BAY61_13380 [Prauserella marina]PWV84260.1 hypothetical protein DES30_101277 [Prauserella marina]SDC26807.1 hypothetical protein SAMN05421630_1011060 [Prauserella marina]
MRRAEIEATAVEHGLGRVVRVHREHAPASLAAGVTGVGTLAAAIVAGLIAASGGRFWQLPLFLAAVAIGLVTLYVHVGPVPGTGRRRYVVAEHGLLILSDREKPVAITYDQRERIRALDLPGTCSVSDLRDVRRRLAPGRRWSRRRLVGLASYGLVAALVAAFGWPVGTYAALGLPLEKSDFAATCDEGGGGHRRAAPHAGDTHPIAAFLDSGGGFLYEAAASVPQGTPLTTEPADLTAVQLVACATLIGFASSTPLSECSYSGVDDELYQGLYRLDVFEARTGRKVASSRLVGSTTETCPRLRTVPRGTPPESRDVATEVDTVDFRRALAPLRATGP